MEDTTVDRKQSKPASRLSHVIIILFCCVLLGLVVVRLYRSHRPGPDVQVQRRSGERPLYLIDINAANVAELSLLPGIGPAKAEGIVTYRREHGPFRSIEELERVSGIGPKMIESIRPLVRLGDVRGPEIATD